MINTYKIDETKNYIKYRTLLPLPIEIVLEYEKQQEENKPANGEDYYCLLSISKQEAAVGVEKMLDIVVNGQKKLLSVKIPAGIKDGTYIRYKEKGPEGKNGGKNGNIYVKISVDMIKATEKQLQEASLHINFMDAVHGIEKNISVIAKEKCETCNGTGVYQNKICQNCKGLGFIVANKMLKVKIRAGIDDGQIVKINNEILYEPVKVRIHVASNPKFERNGVHVHTNKYISKQMAKEGGIIPIETVHGIHLLQMEGPIQQGTRMCIKNKGIPYLKNPEAFGDHYVTFLVW